MLLLKFVALTLLFFLAIRRRNDVFKTVTENEHHIGNPCLIVPHSWCYLAFSQNQNRFAPISFAQTGSLFQLNTLLLLAGDISINPGPINFGFCNCGSMRNKGPKIEVLVSSNSFDVFGLTETHIRPIDTESFLKSLTPNGYKLFHVDRIGKLCGGVGFLVKDSFDCAVVSSPSFGSFESMVVSVKSGSKCVNFVSVYRPPDLSPSEFRDDFMSFYSFLATKSAPVVISGDFNFHWDVDSDSENLQFRALLDSCNLTQHVDFPTHVFGHTMDFIITQSDFCGISGIRNAGCISDHFSVACVFDLLSPNRCRKKVISFRQYHKIDEDWLMEDLRESDFVKTPSNTATKLFEQYNSSLVTILNKHAPEKTKTLEKPAPLWISDEYRKAKALRRQYERVWRKNKTPLTRSRLRKQVNHSNNVLNKAKATYYTDIITNSSGDSKKLWKNMNNILHKKGDTVLPEDTDEKSLADKFSAFFIDKITRIRNTFTAKSSRDVKPKSKPALFSKFHQVSESDVRKFIMSSPTKSCVLDPWPTFLVKECVDVLLPSITKLVNLSLVEGLFPSGFKQAVVTPLLKKASLAKDEFKNYRPVSGLCFMSKLVERVVASQAKDHLDKHNLGNKFQSAYKSGHSTETALLCIKNDVHLSLSQGMPTALVLLDLSAAFDTIDHKGLFECLSSWFGFTDTVLKWFVSYLTSRQQSVKVGSVLSNPSELKFGVPQGSVLGPILFSLYTIPLSKVISVYKDIKFHFYADDTQLYFHLTPKSSQAAFSQLQQCLCDVQDWMNSNKLKLNPDKTEFILFGSKQQRDKLSSCFPVDILGSLLCPASKVRNLGVVFDSGFTFSSHVASVCQKCFVGLRDFRRIRRYLSKDAAITLANALISSKLDYCNSLFRSLSSKDLHKLQCIQNSVARIVYNKPRFSHITPVLKDLHWLPIKYRSIFKTLCIVHKFLQSGLPKYFSPYLNFYTSSVNTRRSNPSKRYLRTHPFSSCTLTSKVQFNHSFAYDAPDLWNSLPDEVRLQSSYLSFRNKLKSHLFTQAYPP